MLFCHTLNDFFLLSALVNCLRVKKIPSFNTMIKIRQITVILEFNDVMITNLNSFVSQNVEKNRLKKSGLKISHYFDVFSIKTVVLTLSIYFQE